MKRVLVGKRNGMAAINWPNVFVAGLMAGAVSGASAAATWFLLTKEFSPFLVATAVFLCFGWFVGDAIRSRNATPLEQLPDLDGGTASHSHPSVAVRK